MPILACLAAQVIDGDSIRCRNLGQVRLLGIDAPDRTDSRPCREGFGDHVCDTAAATRAKLAMRAALKLGPVRVEVVGRDRYGRALGMVTAGPTVLNCRMLRVPGVRYIQRYDDGGRVARACR
jgi:micrococcal nuclease